MNVIPIAGVKAPAREEYNIVGADKLFAPLPPVDWLCQTLRIAPGAPTLFAGYGYSGKSVALQSLALSVASGTALWGSRACKRGRVLHLDYEQGLRVTAGRYQRLAHHEAIDASSVVGWLECGVLPSAGVHRDSLSWMGEGRTLVIIDSWRAAHAEVDENSSEVRKTLDAMGMASEKTGCTFATLSHARKPQKESPGGDKMSIRGSSGFFDGCQTVYLFDGEEVGAPVVSLKKDRIQGASVDPFVLRIEDTDGGAGLSVRAHTIEAPPAKDTFEETSAAVLRFVIDNPGVAGVEVLAERLQRRVATVRAIIQSAEAEGVILRVKAPGKGNGVRLFHSSANVNPDSSDDATPF